MSHSDLQGVLVRDGLVNAEQLQYAIVNVRGTDTTWLEYLLITHQIDEATIARCAAIESCVPRCSLDRLARVPADVIARIPRDLAIEHRIVPLWVEPDGDLCCGMVDPCDLDAVREVEFMVAHRILREVVPATPMAWALHTYYGATSALWHPAAPAQPRRTSTTWS